MPLPAELDRKIRLRFDELIEEAETLIAELDGYDLNHYSQYLEWVVKTSGLILNIFGNSKQAEKYQRIFETEPPPEQSYASFTVGYDSKSGGEISGSSSSYMPPFLRSITISKKVAILKGIRDSYVNGFYISLEKQIVSNVSADYMEQAEALLGERISGQNDHVPAAVLCVAVLEDALRRLCQKQTPPIDIVKPNGDKKTLEPLIQDLHRAKVFNKSVADQLRAWAKIRNYAAHGEFSEFTREQVNLMLLGVKQFLAVHM